MWCKSSNRAAFISTANTQDMVQSSASPPCITFPARPWPWCRYIRYIYNRIILENATVRAAAVSALASFGARVPELTGRVVVLLKRALYDNDDEVRRDWRPHRFSVHAPVTLCALRTSLVGTLQHVC